MWRINLIEDNSFENLLSTKKYQQLQGCKTNYCFTIVLRSYLTIPIKSLSKPTKTNTKIKRNFNNSNSNNSSNNSSRSSSRTSICSTSSSNSSNLSHPPSLLRLDYKQSLLNSQKNTSENLSFSLSNEKLAKNMQQIEPKPKNNTNDLKLNKELKTNQNIIKSLNKDLSNLTQQTKQVDLETRFPLICCHIDIKQQFIQSIKKGQNICA